MNSNLADIDDVTSADAIFVTEFGVSNEDLSKAKTYQQRNGGKLEQILVRMGALSSEELPRYYSAIFSLPLYESSEADLTQIESLDSNIQSSLIAMDCLPLQFDAEQSSLQVVTQDPTRIEVNEYLYDLGFDIVLHVCNEDTFRSLRSQLEAETKDEVESTGLSVVEEDRLRELASEAPTVNLLNSLITRALRQRASDMHIEPYRGRGRVRYRIDGVLHEADTIPQNMILPVITRLKLLSKMDIAEKRRPQDGKIEMRVDGYDVDIRISALPLGEGESVVMRFLLQNALSFDVAALGIESDIENLLLKDINSTSGVVLMTGPTGSGKTTSLYSFLSIRNNDEVKVITIEDPIEYQLEGINQVQVQPEIGYNFAAALRSVVRQDPDIIMVGEIRDKETAGIAMQSAITGHLVFSTLHTNDAPSAYTRLLDLGVDEFLLNAAVKSIIAQRLVRKLCPHCAIEDLESRERLNELNLTAIKRAHPDDFTVKRAVGCEKCANTGYSGRIAIVEYLRCDEALMELPKDDQFIGKARAVNHERGMRTLFEDGLLKVVQGKTTLDEVIRVAG